MPQFQSILIGQLLFHLSIKLLNSFIRLTGVLIAAWAVSGFCIAQESKLSSRLDFQPLPDLPDPIGVAGPIVGVVNGTLIVAGGANFALKDDPQLWELPKVYHDRAWILRRYPSDSDEKFRWQPFSDSDRISAKIAYTAVVSCPRGVLCFGGENADGPQKRAFLLSTIATRDGSYTVLENDLGVPDLPLPCTAGGAAIVDGHV